MTDQHLLLIRHSSKLRTIGEEEILSCLPPNERLFLRRDIVIDSTRFAADVEGGYWREVHGHLREEAARVRQAASQMSNTRLLYFGLDEVPSIVALAAYIGDEYRVEVHDYDRDCNSWSWPEEDRTLDVELVGLPTERLERPGPIVIRVEISSAIADADVDAVIGREKLADVSIRLGRSRTPARSIVRSAADLEAIRKGARLALANLRSTRPNADTIHLFLAAPVSVCFAIGQELHLRSGAKVQTYRHRVVEGERSYKAAIELSEGPVTENAAPARDNAVAVAHRLRTEVWPRALKSVIEYAMAKREMSMATGDRWFKSLGPAGVLSEVAPFPSLPPLWSTVDPNHRIAPERKESEYGLDKDNSVWRLSDQMVLSYYGAAMKDEARLEDLIRLFFFHEYLHDWQGLTKYNSEQVGRFANCLERVDYTADAYAILHQLDFVLCYQPERVATPKQQLTFLAEQIDLALRSFWVFQPPPPHYEFQERALRRFMNWFWRQVQIRRAVDLQSAIRLLARQPAIEIAGLQYRTGGGRVLVVLNEARLGRLLEIGIVLEDGEFERMSSVTGMDIVSAMDAFGRQDHEAVRLFFNAVFEEFRSKGSVFPSW